MLHDTVRIKHNGHFTSDHRPTCYVLVMEGIRAVVNESGLFGGSGASEAALAAIIAPQLPAGLRHLWPCWEYADEHGVTVVEVE